MHNRNLHAANSRVQFWNPHLCWRNLLRSTRVKMAGPDLNVRSPHAQMITLNIPRIAMIKGVQRPYSFLVRHGFTPQTAKDLVAGRIKRLDLGHLERLCRIFQCEPNDLYDYKPGPDVPVVGKDHLAFLTKPKVEASIHSIISGFSLGEMESLLKELAQRRGAA